MSKMDSPGTGSFWVIETARTTYWNGHVIETDSHFTKNIDDAIQFAGFDSAETIRCWLFGSIKNLLCSVEHVYMKHD